jgi:hypothetical protein
MQGDDFRQQVDAALLTFLAPPQEARRQAELFFQGAQDGSVELRQQFLDALVELATTGVRPLPVRAMTGLALMKLHSVRVSGLRLDKLFEAFLTTRLRAARLLVSPDEQERVAIPDDVVERARQSENPAALALWLASDAPDVSVALEKAMSLRCGFQESLMACLARAARKHPDVAEITFRRNLAQGRDTLAFDLQLLREAGVRFHATFFSEKEWDQLRSADLVRVEHLWHCFADDARPDRLVEQCLQQIVEQDGADEEMITMLWPWLRAAEAAMLINFFGEANRRGDDAALAWMVARPLAPMSVRESHLHERLARPGFWYELDARDGCTPADWKCFSSEQLVRFAELEPGLVLLLSFARELVARNMVLKAVLRRALLQPNHLVRVGRAALCWYALHDVSSFDDVKVEPCLARDEDRARDVIFALLGHWTARYHRLMPRRVRQVAPLVVWALVRRVGTRHVVYMILERALVSDWRDRFVHVPREVFDAVIGLLRR